MNIFRLVGDMTHLLAFVVLILKIHKTKNCHGLSCKTQEIYLIVFCTRYLDLFLYVISFYNTSMKIGFILSTAYIIYLMRFKKPYNATYDRIADNFKYPIYLLPACALFALIFNLELSL